MVCGGLRCRVVVWLFNNLYCSRPAVCHTPRTAAANACSVELLCLPNPAADQLETDVSPAHVVLRKMCKHVRWQRHGLAVSPALLLLLHFAGLLGWLSFGASCWVGLSGQLRLGCGWRRCLLVCGPCLALLSWCWTLLTCCLLTSAL